MKRRLCSLIFLCVFAIGSLATAETVAYWRFEDGVAGENVTHLGDTSEYTADIVDESGNGNHLSTWQTGSDAGYMYMANVGVSTIPQTGDKNTLSVKNTGAGPAMWCSAEGLQSLEPSQFTIEVTCKIENNGYKTIIGRDSYGTYAGEEALAALYLQVIGSNALGIKYCDVDGYWHEAVSEEGVYTGFDYSSDPDGDEAPWTSIAVISDGSILSLYMLEHGSGQGYQLIAQTDMTTSGSTNTALTAGDGDGDDWDAGDWTIGRGLYGGAHVDRGYGYVDEVRISDSALTLTELLMGPTPYDGQETQASDAAEGNVDVTLTWTAAGDPNNAVLPEIVDQYIFLSEVDSNDPNVYYYGQTGVDPGTDPASSYGPIDLEFDASYQWAIVDAVDGYEQTFVVGESTLNDVEPNNITGPVWSFDTLASVPSITDQPEDVLADVGETVQFTVAADSISDKHYTWYKSDDDTVSEDDSSIDDSDSATLELSPVAVSDEGFYYCVVSNDSSETDTSDVVFLEIKQLVAWYAFDGDVTDSANDYDGTVVKTDPNESLTFVTSDIADQAVSLNGDDEGVEIPRSIQNSMSIAMWVKTTATGSVGNGWFDGKGLVDGEIAGYEHDDFGTSLRGSNFCFGVGELSGSYANATSEAVINDGEWHYCVATRDHTTGEIVVYVDGSMEDSNTAPTGTKDEPEVLRIGSILTGINFFEGQLDEVKLYNYPLSELDVAANYNTVTDESVCIESERPSGIYDFNGDCVVDLTDLSEFAAAWLDCGLYPDCVQ